MTDALLLLLDRNAHPGTLEDTALAAMQLKGVVAVRRLPRFAEVAVETIRGEHEAAMGRLAAECAAARASEDERLRQVGAL